MKRKDWQALWKHTSPPAAALIVIAALFLWHAAGSGHTILRQAQAEDVTPSDIQNGRQFSERDIRGPYGFSFAGFVNAALPDGSTLPVPVAAVGRLIADGKGGVVAQRTLSFGGEVIEQEGDGSYEVRPDGTGSATFDIVIVDQMRLPPAGLQLPPATIESFSFVLTNFAGGLQFIGTSVLDAASKEPIGGIAVRGELHAQR